MSGLPSGRVKESVVGEKAPQLLKKCEAPESFKRFSRKSNTEE